MFRSKAENAGLVVRETAKFQPPAYDRNAGVEQRECGSVFARMAMIGASVPNYVWSRFRLSNAKCLGGKPHFIGKIWFHGGGSLILGSRVVLDASQCPIELHVVKGARLTIGDDVTVASGASIEVTGAIDIESGSRIGPFCKILDNNWHPLRGERVVDLNEMSRPAPMRIGERAVLEERVILLPGAQIGADAKVLARSVVSRPVAPKAVAQGCPARIIARDTEKSS
jgi:acetyltransferase-like isoleucine patch superfamily enzyme